MVALGDWQGNVLHLAPELTLQALNGQPLAVFAFPQKVCTVDDGALRAVDSIGIAALLNLHRAARRQGVQLAWQAQNERLRHLLALYGLDFSQG
ncbi:MAG: STAS domain-containing protein [Cardiobacteriaceae bacterium]|nr:STAS domain-containing protein [Cardiobacteriaceae bacterium]